MSTGPDDDARQEPTFADVMNGFSLDAGRKPRKRRWGRNSGNTEPPPEPVESTGPISGPAGSGLPPTPTEAPVAPPPAHAPAHAPAPPPPPPEAPAGGGASSVRPYAWTGGRTKSGFELAIETLVSVSDRARSRLDRLPMEHRAVADLLLEQTRSVAEVAALLSLPLGVARVLLGDMAAGGTVTVHQTASTAGNVPDLALMERVLSGLRRL